MSSQNVREKSGAESIVDPSLNLVVFGVAEAGGHSPIALRREAVDRAELNHDGKWKIYLSSGSSFHLAGIQRISSADMTNRLFPEALHRSVLSIDSVCKNLVNPDAVLSVASGDCRVMIELRSHSFSFHTVNPQATPLIIGALYGERNAQPFQGSMKVPVEMPKVEPLSPQARARERELTQARASRLQEAEQAAMRAKLLAPVSSADSQQRNAQIWGVVEKIGLILDWSSVGGLSDIEGMRPKVHAFEERKKALRLAASKLRREDSRANLDAVLALVDGMASIMQEFPRGIQGVKEIQGLYSDQFNRFAELQHQSKKAA